MTFEIEGPILKMTLPQKNGHRIKTLSSKLTILVSSCWETNFICNNAHNYLILLLVSFKLLLKSVAFFLGHPVYFKKLVIRQIPLQQVKRHLPYKTFTMNTHAMRT